MTKLDDEVEERNSNFTLGPHGERIYGNEEPIDSEELKNAKLKNVMRSKVLELLKKGKEIPDIARELKIKSPSVHYHVNKLKELGLWEGKEKHVEELEVTEREKGIAQGIEIAVNAKKGIEKMQEERQKTSEMLYSEDKEQKHLKMIFIQWLDHSHVPLADISIDEAKKITPVIAETAGFLLDEDDECVRITPQIDFTQWIGEKMEKRESCAFLIVICKKLILQRRELIIKNEVIKS
jgi:DNA-binding Lrp family transcriptional regulator